MQDLYKQSIAQADIVPLLTWPPSATEASQACPRWPAGGAPDPQPHDQPETKEQVEDMP